MSLAMQCRVERRDFSIDVDLTIAPASVLGIAGENGSGKTTTLDVVAGLLPCSTGRVVIDGSVVDDAANGIFVQPENRGVATLFQGGGLIPHLTVARNITFGRGRDLRSSTRFDEVTEAFDLHNLLSRRPDELSGGQRQRAALARAFLAPSQVLLLDEPTTFLDVEARTTVRRLMKDWFTNYDGVVVLVSHDPTEVEELADAVARVEITRGATTAATLSNC